MTDLKSKKSKILYLMKILLENTDEEHGMTINELSDALGEYGISAERKSLYSDFTVLEDLGISVQRTKGKQTKYYVDYFMFELAELKMLVDAVQSSKFITAKKSRDIISRLESFTSVHKKAELSRQVYVEDRVKTANNASLYTVDAVHGAINSDKRLRFHYFEYDSSKEKRLRRDGEFYTVSPLALIWSDENYYLVAYEEAADRVKHFRIDKMLDVSPLDEHRAKCEATERFNPSDYSRKVFGMYGGREELVSFDCREKLAGVIIDRFGTEPTFRKSEFGFRFSLRVMVSPTFFAWVMGFGEDIKITAPESVKEELVDILSKTAALYGGIKNEEV